MLSSPRQHIITRALTDASDAKLLDPQSEKRLRQEFEEVRTSARRNTRRSLSVLCDDADNLCTADPKDPDQFLTPQYLVDNTRLLLSAVGHIERARKKGQKPPTLSKMAELLKVDAAQIRLAIAQVFVNPNPSYQQILDLCNPKQPKQRKGQVDLQDEHSIGPILKHVVCTGQFPTRITAPELFADTDETPARLKKRIRRILIDDLKQVVQRFDDAGFSINDVILNSHSIYFREYGIRVYCLLFDNNLSSFYRAFGSDKRLQQDIKKVFNPWNSLNLYEHNLPGFGNHTAMHWAHVPDSLVAKLDQVHPREETISMVESHFGITLPPRFRRDFKPDTAKAILTFWSKHNLCFLPHYTWFIYGPDGLRQLIANYEKLLNIIDPLGLPFKTRTRLLCIRIPPEELERRIGFFEARGLPLAMAAPYLAILGKKDRLRCSAAGRIRNAICVQQRMERTPSCNPKGHPEVVTTATPDRWAALHWLSCYDRDYDAYSPRTRRLRYPEVFAKGVQLFKEIGANPLPHWLATLSLARIREQRHDCARVMQQKHQSAQRYSELMRARGFNSFPELRPTKAVLKAYSHSVIATRIDGAETQAGFALFTPENIQRGSVNWKWLLDSPRQLGVHIAKLKRKLCKTNLMYELEELYGMDMTDVPNCVAVRTPGFIWQQCRALESVDLHYSDLAGSVLAKGSFRDDLFYRLDHLRAQDHSLTSRQEHFLAQYDLAGQASKTPGWGNARDLFVHVTPEELPRIRKTVAQLKGNPNAGQLWKQRLEKRAQQKKDVLKELLQTDASFSRMNALLRRFSPAELLDRFAVFDELKKPVNTDLLFSEPGRIREILLQHKT